MQYRLKDLLRPEHILLNLNASSAREAIDQTVAALVRTGHAEPAFAEDVWQREQVFPTGLPTQPLATALPHADPEHVRQTAVAISTLKAPVRFGQMGTDGSIGLDVHILFLLAIKEREKQVELIQEVVGLLQSPGLLEQLMSAQSPEQALQVLHRALNAASAP